MAKLVKHIRIRENAIYIDGEEFPYEVLDTVTVETDSSGMSKLTLTIPTWGRVFIEGIDA